MRIVLYGEFVSPGRTDGRRSHPAGATHCKSRGSTLTECDLELPAERSTERRSKILAENLANDVAFNIGQAALDAVMFKSQSFVIEAEQM